MDEGEPLHEVEEDDNYQIDSEGYDSDEERDEMREEEYDQLVDEAENGYTDEETRAMIADLKQQGLFTFLKAYLEPDARGESASLRKLLLALGCIPPAPLRDPSTPNILLLPFTKLVLSRLLRRREKLPQYNTVIDAVHLLKSSKKIIVLSGAGISTSCGIPDFRSSTGLYAQLQAEGKYELDDPQQMFDIQYFKEHPEVFYSFAKQIYPSNFVPSACHRWIKLLEDRNVLLRNYTQNIDTLESLAGVTKVLQCHGSFKTASCLRCKVRVPGQTIEPYILASEIPYCGPCKSQRERRKAELAIKTKIKSNGKGKGRAKGWGSSSDDDDEEEWGGGEPGIIKPDITFFGQALDSQFDQCLAVDREEVDLLVIIGTSLKVAPVSEVLTHIPHTVPQIFINLTPVSHVTPDICLLGDADTIVTYLSKELGWEIPPPIAVPAPVLNGTSSKEREGEREERGRGRPEEVVWRSGVGEMAHMHLLSSEAELVNRSDSPKSDSGGLYTPNSRGRERNGEDAGDEVDRPSKKARLKES